MDKEMMAKIGEMLKARGMQELNTDELGKVSGGDPREASAYLETLARKYNIDVNDLKLADYLTEEEFRHFVELARSPSRGAEGGW
jgi:hypothetical protein